MSKTVSLVLGSGGARGYAHIGAIEAITAAGLHIKAIAGCSMGALIGGLYANGTLPDYRDWVQTLDVLNILKLLDPAFRGEGMIKGEKLFEVMGFIAADTKIEDLPLSYTAVAVDLVTRKEVWFQRGNLRLAIRASIAIPQVFTPVRSGRRVLVDGGVLNPLPLAATLADHTDLTIAIDVNARVALSPPSVLPDTGHSEPTTLGIGVGQFLHNLGLSGRRRGLGLSGLELLSRAFETMQQSLTNYKIAGYPPDVLVEIPAEVCNFYDFHKATQIIELGRRLTATALEQAAQKGLL